jgi:hypothetical protein
MSSLQDSENYSTCMATIITSLRDYALLKPRRGDSMVENKITEHTECRRYDIIILPVTGTIIYKTSILKIMQQTQRRW